MVIRTKSIKIYSKNYKTYKNLVKISFIFQYFSYQKKKKVFHSSLKIKNGNQYFFIYQTWTYNIHNLCVLFLLIIQHNYSCQQKQIDLGFREWNIALCSLLCQANSNIATVKVRSMYEMEEECKTLMGESFINKSRNPLVYLGRRIK